MKYLKQIGKGVYKMKYTKEERETIIRFDEADLQATIYTCNQRMKNRMKSIQEQHPEEVKLIREDEHSITYTFPKAWVKINPPRQLSTEEKERLSERMRNARFASKSQ